jgi:hypothetical protein
MLLNKVNKITPLMVIIICLLCLFLNAPSTKPLNCDMECGEALLSLKASQDFGKNGVQYGLLENLGTQQEPSIYTHNVNIGGLTFIGLEAIGVADTYKFLLPLFIYGLGLGYVYLTVRRISRNEHLALITLIICATTYWGLGAFAFNSLRAWHTLAFFSVIFHAYGLSQYKTKIKEILGLLFGATVAFGCGYDFWVVCLFVATLTALANIQEFSLKKIIGLLIIVGVIFLTPFLARQVHVANAMGIAFWAKDFMYSVAIKVPYANEFIKIPSLADVDYYYKTQNVYRPPAQPTNSAKEILFTFRHMVTSITLPRWGWLSLVTLIIVNIFASIQLILRAPIINKKKSPNKYLIKLDAIKKIRLNGEYKYISALILPATIGSILGLIIFAPFSIHVYLKHEFPLLVFILVLSKGLIVYFLLNFIFKNKTLIKNFIAGIILIILLIDCIMVHWNNSKFGPSLKYDWGKFYEIYPNESVGLTTYKLLETADPFIGIDRSRTQYVTADQMLSGQTNLQYWIYQPRERFVDFDSSIPLCNWTNWTDRIFESNVQNRQIGLSCIYNQPIPKGSIRELSVTEIVEKAAGNYSVVDIDNSTNGYVILKRK